MDRPSAAGTRRRDTLISLALAAAIFGGWLGCHIYAVWLFRPQPADAPLALALIALLCWLNVGLFIVAHDCMHGSLAPGRPWLNRAAGRIALLLYAGFSLDRLHPKHFAHHRAPGSAEDPDFSADHPTRFWPWYFTFMTRYFGLTEFLILCVPILAYLLLGVPVANLLLFWALPAILSSLQLFYFGTFRPHRHDGQAFADRHNARSNDFGWIVSLFTCFHFGYHREHHLHPHLPWWRLPAARARYREREFLPGPQPG